MSDKIPPRLVRARKASADAVQACLRAAEAYERAPSSAARAAYDEAHRKSVELEAELYAAAVEHVANSAKVREDGER